MTPPALATITGECWGNQGGAFPGAIVFTPVSLNERDGPVDSASRVRAVAHADASLTLLDGSPVRLWPGLWECLMPDGQTWQFLVAAGQTYTLAYLRGQVLTLVELSGVDAVGLPYGTAPTATLDGGHITWGIPAGAQGDPGPAGVTSVDSTDLPYGQESTVSLVDGLLTIGLPAGAPGTPGAVQSVNGQTGASVLDAADVGADPSGAAAAEAAERAAADIALGQRIDVGQRIDAGQKVANALRLQTGDVAIGIAGDSTSNGATEWIDTWAGSVAAADPIRRVEISHWNAVASAYDAVTVIQEGGSALSAKVVDTFTRTGADLYGSLPDLGSAWGGDGSSSPGDYSIDGASAVATADATRGVMLADPLVTGDARVTLSGVLTSVPVGGVGHNYNFYLAHRSPSNHLFLRLGVAASGTTTLTLFKRIGGAATSIGSAATPLPANVSGQTYTATVTLVGTAVTATLNGTTITGVITSGDVAALGSRAGFSLALVGDVLDSFELDVAERARVLTLYNASVSGSTLATQQAALTTMYPAPLDLLVINSGHNYLAGTPAQYESAIDAFVAAFRAGQPTAGIIVSSQNPERPPSALWATHLARQVGLRSYCARRGLGYLPAIEDFHAQPDHGDSMILPDGVHPTTGAGSGSELWAGVMTTYMAAI